MSKLGFCPFYSIGQTKERYCLGAYCELAAKDENGRFVNCAIVQLAENKKLIGEKEESED